MESVRIIFEVTAGMLPPEVQMQARNEIEEMVGTGVPTGWQRPRPDDRFTRQYAVTSAEYETAGLGFETRQEFLTRRYNEALEYARELMLSGLNWVRVDWIYL